MKAITQKDFEDRVRAHHGGKLSLTSKYVNTRTKITYECRTCGYSGSILAKNLMEGQGCRQCGRSRSGLTRSMTKEHVLDCLEKNTNFRITGKYVNENTPVEVQCKICGRRYQRKLRQYCFNKEGRFTTGCCYNTAVAKNSSGPKSRSKTIVLNGKRRKVQGYEPQAIDYLVKTKGIAESEIRLKRENIPRIPFVYAGVHHSHFPDIYVPCRKLIVEVKSTYTAGLLREGNRERTWFEKLIQKKVSAELLGYKYNVLVMSNRGERIVLPKDWHAMSHNEIVIWRSTKGCR